MKSKKEFTKLIDKRFFSHLNSDSLIPFNEKRGRVDFLSSTYDELLSKITNYKPKLPRKYISIPKSSYAIRMVPTFELDDYCIYYFCVKVLEDYIAENRVEGTFGGFRLGGKLRKKESKEFETSFEDSFNENSFNVFAWKQEYGEYQAKLQELALKMGEDYDFAVQFDIANFYDCIRLDLLERKIRLRVDTDLHNDEIHILFQFLKYWNSKLDFKKSVGIPQDEVGECSRILSNFFLQDYDKFVFDKCLEKEAKFLRYADDQIIFTKSKEDAEELMYDISCRLFEEGLNINIGKTKEFKNFQELDNTYGWSIFENLSFDTQNVNKAFEQFVISKDSYKDFRFASVLKRLLHSRIRIEDLQNQNRIKLISFLWDKDFLLFSNSHYMEQIYGMLRNTAEKEEYLNTLKDIEMKTKFESYKIHHDTFLKSIKNTSK